MKTKIPSPVFYTPENYSPQVSVAYLMLRNKSIYQRLGDIRLSQLGITAAQMSVLLIIFHSESALISSISQSLGVDPAATVRIVQKLIELGHLKKTRSKTDGRVHYLNLTSKGKKIALSIPPIWCELLNQSLSGFSVAEFKQLKDFLMRIERNNLLQIEKFA